MPTLPRKVVAERRRPPRRSLLWPAPLPEEADDDPPTPPITPPVGVRRGYRRGRANSDDDDVSSTSDDTSGRDKHPKRIRLEPVADAAAEAETRVAAAAAAAAADAEAQHDVEVLTGSPSRPQNGASGTPDIPTLTRLCLQGLAENLDICTRCWAARGPEPGS